MDDFDLLLQEVAEEASSQSSEPKAKKPSNKKGDPKKSSTKYGKFDSKNSVKPQDRPYTTNPKGKNIEKSSSESNLSDVLNYEEHVESSYHEQSERSFIDPITSLKNQIEDVRKRKQEDLERQNNELSQFHEKTITERNQRSKELREEIKERYETELKDLENMKISYSKMQNLTDSLGFNTNLLNNLSLKLNETKEVEETGKYTKLVQFEKTLQEREARILNKEQQVERDFLILQEKFENAGREENEIRGKYESEQGRIRAEKEKIFQVFQMIQKQIHEKKQDLVKETHKIKMQQESLAKRKDQVRKGVSARLQELQDYEDLMIQKHEETIKLINLERRQMSEKRDRLEEIRNETRVFEEKISKNTAIIERREQELNLEVEDLMKSKNAIEIQRAHLESEMQSMHLLSVKLHNQSEGISKSKEQLEIESNSLIKQEEDVENMKVYSKHELLTAKETWKQLEQQMRTFERMSVNLIQDISPDTSSWLLN
ncbi:hypothetical protein SteCoe_23427 [Stentor coeruleus]|uniref:Uncharacterized protein n=1 Tax=Stentor coeruleus TaxID=5963 RepID=A0A1R2BKD6_9CILI|nr:hypothetical protein SteCoe_23427 [Stentor coeruleus]